MLFIKDTAAGLFLTKVDDSAPVVELTGLYRELWLYLASDKASSGHAPLDQALGLKCKECISFLALHEMLPEGVSESKALARLNHFRPSTLASNLSGHYHASTQESPIQIVASLRGESRFDLCTADGEDYPYPACSPYK